MNVHAEIRRIRMKVAEKIASAEYERERGDREHANHLLRKALHLRAWAERVERRMASYEN